MTSKAKTEMDAAWDELEACYAAVKEADRVEQAARTDATNARNRLNRAQKQWDALGEKLREAAPWNTEWHAQRQRPQPA